MIRKILSTIGKAVDIQDCIVFGGLGIMGYGLYLYHPWIAYAVCGAVLMGIGLFVGKGKI